MVFSVYIYYMSTPKVIINVRDIISITFVHTNRKHKIRWSVHENLYEELDTSLSARFSRQYLNEQYNNGNLIINYIERN